MEGPEGGLSRSRRRLGARTPVEILIDLINVRRLGSSIRPTFSAQRCGSHVAREFTKFLTVRPRVVLPHCPEQFDMSRVRVAPSFPPPPILQASGDSYSPRGSSCCAGDNRTRIICGSGRKGPRSRGRRCASPACHSFRAFPSSPPHSLGPTFHDPASGSPSRATRPPR